MIDLTKWHNWLAIALIVFVVGFLAHQAAARFSPAQNVVRASFGS